MKKKLQFLCLFWACIAFASYSQLGEKRFYNGFNDASSLDLVSCDIATPTQANGIMTIAPAGPLPDWKYIKFKLPGTGNSVDISGYPHTFVKILATDSIAFRLTAYGAGESQWNDATRVKIYGDSVWHVIEINWADYQGTMNLTRMDELALYVASTDANWGKGNFNGIIQVDFTSWGFDPARAKASMLGDNGNGKNVVYTNFSSESDTLHGLYINLGGDTYIAESALVTEKNGSFKSDGGSCIFFNFQYPYSREIDLGRRINVTDDPYLRMRVMATDTIALGLQIYSDEFGTFGTSADPWWGPSYKDFGALLPGDGIWREYEFKLDNPKWQNSLNLSYITNLATWVSSGLWNYCSYNFNGILKYDFISFGVNPYNNVNVSYNKTFVSNQSISIYPNPVANELHIIGANGSKMEIYHISGQKILHFDNIKGSVDVSSLKKGTYFVRIVGVGNEANIFKLVKM